MHDDLGIRDRIGARHPSRRATDCNGSVSPGGCAVHDRKVGDPCPADRLSHRTSGPTGTDERNPPPAQIDPLLDQQASNEAVAIGVVSSDDTIIIDQTVCGAQRIDHR